jgi:hypothetical protein
MLDGLPSAAGDTGQKCKPRRLSTNLADFIAYKADFASHSAHAARLYRRSSLSPLTSSSSQDALLA